jgi:predicted membrane protein
MTSYVFLSISFAIITTFLCIGILYVKRYMIIKPTFIFVAFFNVQVQWGAALKSHYIETILKEPWDFFWVTQFFPIVVLLFGYFILNKRTKKVFDKIFINENAIYTNRALLTYILLFFVTAIITYYLLIIPFDNNVIKVGMIRITIKTMSNLIGLKGTLVKIK